MKDHVEIDHLTKYDVEIWLKIHTNVSDRCCLGAVTHYKSY